MQLWYIRISVTVEVVGRVLLFPATEKEEDCPENGGESSESADDTASDGTSCSRLFG